MKRFLSVLIALILLVSVFSVTAVAFAEPGIATYEVVGDGRVTFNVDAFKTKVFANHSYTIEMSKNFMLDSKVKTGSGDDEVVWFKDYDLIHEIFPGIKYIVLADEDIEEAEDDDETATAAEVTTHSLTYNYNVPADFVGDKPTEPEAKEYQVTQHVELADAPKLDGYVFAGWSFPEDFDAKVTEFKGSKFAEGFKFNMPDKDVEITANWEENKEDEEVDVELYANDAIYLLYCNPSSDPKDDMKNWTRCNVTDTFNLTDEGWWSFRFAVVDGEKLDEDGKFDFEKDVLVTTYANVEKAIKEGQTDEATLQSINYTLYGYTGDVTNPVVDLSESMKTKMEEGLTAGTNYTISTTLEVEDASGYSVTYKVWKKVGDVEGAEDGWIVIYDSTLKTDERVTEGYEECITSAGVIKPLDSDVTGDYVYRIVYSVTDNHGFYGVKKAGDTEEHHPTLELKVNAKSSSKGSEAVEAWKIVLYVIAGLSAVGIVVLLFIKPKQQTVTVEDGRYNANASTGDGSDDKKE